VAVYSPERVTLEGEAIATIDWDGRSGTKYHYWVYDIGTSLKQAAGNYVFASQTEPGRYRPIYVGQTADLSERFENHHQMPCIRQYGATHICAHTHDAGEAARRTEETDIIQRWNPVCNEVGATAQAR